MGRTDWSERKLLHNVSLTSYVGSPDILEKFDATFETYWESPEYESYEPARDAARFGRAVAPAQGDFLEVPLLFLDVEPWPHARRKPARPSSPGPAIGRLRRGYSPADAEVCGNPGDVLRWLYGAMFAFIRNTFVGS